VATIGLLLAVIMMKRMSPLIALILIPLAASLIGGFGRDTSRFVVSGCSRWRRWSAGRGRCTWRDASDLRLKRLNHRLHANPAGSPLAFRR
jgi:hypothetical protein